MNVFFTTVALLILAVALSSAQITNMATNASPSALAPDPFDDLQIQKLQARHEKAVKGDTKETALLTADLEKWTKEQPTNYLLLAYLGSAYTLCSRDAWPGPGKLTYLRKGGQTLDAAVAAAPDNPAVRLIRALDYFELPAIFGKRQQARDDFQYLVRQVEGLSKSPFLLNTSTSQAIYYYAGLSYKQVGQRDQARAVWQQGFKLASATDLGIKMQAELKKLK